MRTTSSFSFIESTFSVKSWGLVINAESGIKVSRKIFDWSCDLIWIRDERNWEMSVVGNLKKVRYELYSSNWESESSWMKFKDSWGWKRVAIVDTAFHRNGRDLGMISSSMLTLSVDD